MLVVMIRFVVFGHAGHWAVDALFVVPVLVLVGAALKERWRARRAPGEDGKRAPD